MSRNQSLLIATQRQFNTLTVIVSNWDTFLSSLGKVSNAPSYVHISAVPISCSLTYPTYPLNFIIVTRQIAHFSTNVAPKCHQYNATDCRENSLLRYSFRRCIADNEILIPLPKLGCWKKNAVSALRGCAGQRMLSGVSIKSCTAKQNKINMEKKSLPRLQLPHVLHCHIFTERGEEEARERGGEEEW